MFRTFGFVLAVVTALCVVSPSHAVEKQAAISGANLAVVAPTFLGAGNVGPQSYIRFFNGSTTATTSTFTVRIVGIPSGQSYGNAFTLAIPSMGSIQYSVAELVGRTGAVAGSFISGDSSYGVYIENSDKQAGYQHVVYDWGTELFENMSNCQSLLNEQTLPNNNTMALINLHTTEGGSARTGVLYPSTIQIHNRDSAAATYVLKVYNAGKQLSTGNLSSNTGKLTCQITGNTVAANSTLSIPFTTIENNAACNLDSDEDYANVIISTSSSGAPNATASHLVQVSKYNGSTSLSDVCAVNKLEPTTIVAAPTTPTAYCGAVNISSPCGTMTVNYILSVAPNGRTRVVTTGVKNSCYVYGTGVGSVSGTSLSFTSQVDGSVAYGTIANGVISANVPNPYYGNLVSGTATTSSCY